jgi:hypothetical protein
LHISFLRDEFKFEIQNRLREKSVLEILYKLPSERRGVSVFVDAVDAINLSGEDQ